LNRQSGENTNFAEKEEDVSFSMVCHVKEETQQNMWYLDTGCSNHMCGDRRHSLTWMNLFAALLSLVTTPWFLLWEKER
jgi:hypothetical protein